MYIGHLDTANLQTMSLLSFLRHNISILSKTIIETTHNLLRKTVKEDLSPLSVILDLPF